jgi:hypothetical protein
VRARRNGGRAFARDDPRSSRASEASRGICRRSSSRT